MFFTRRSLPAWLRFPAPVAVALLAVLAAATGGWLLAGADHGLSRRHVVVAGVPLDEVHPAGVPAGQRRPGVVVAHGFAGSAKLMAQFGDTLSARGYVVVLLDFTGHGASTRRLPTNAAATDVSSAVLNHDLDVAMTHLRGLPDVDPSRVALVGHSMGATEVTQYALAHPAVRATVAISLPDSSFVPPDRPARLLLLVGGLEFPGFRAAASAAVAGATDRSMVVVPGVEHISILYAARTHQEIVRWLDATFGGPIVNAPIPPPTRRLTAAGLLLLAMAIGLYPVARLILGDHSAGWPSIAVPRIGRILAVAAAAVAVAALVAPVVPTSRLPLAVGGYLVGFTTAAGAAMLAYHRWRGTTVPAPTAGPGGLRLALGAPVLIGYAAMTIALPLQLGVTNTLPVGARWWLLGCVWAGFAVLSAGAERVTGGNSFGVLAVSAVAVIGLTCAVVAGLTSGFLLLILPLLVVLLAWQAIWSAVLHRFSAPPLVNALMGSLLVAWPLASALPIVR